MVQKDVGEENVVAVKQQLSTKVQVEVQQDTKVQVTLEAQQRAMEMEWQKSEIVMRRKHTILD